MEETSFYKDSDGTEYMVIKGVYYRKVKPGWIKMKAKPDTTEWTELSQTKEGGSSPDGPEADCQ